MVKNMNVYKNSYWIFYSNICDILFFRIFVLKVVK